MKKVVIAVVAILVLIGGICFGIKSKIYSEIESKVDELNQNGFLVNYEKIHIPLFAKVIGEAKIIDGTKALEYSFNRLEDGELKSAILNIINIFPDDEKNFSLNGIAFDYDLKVSVFSQALDLNINLLKLSDELDKELNTNINDSDVKTIKNLLEKKFVSINIDENYKYRLKDIDEKFSNANFKLSNMYGDKNSLNFGEFKAVIDNLKIDIEDLKVFYKEKDLKIDSKLSLKDFFIGDDELKIYSKNLNIDSISDVKDDKLKASSKFLFDSFEVEQNGFEKESLKFENSELFVEYDNLPYKAYVNFIDAYNDLATIEQSEADSLKLVEKLKEFFEELSKSQMDIKLDLKVNNLDFNQNRVLNDLDLKSKFKLSEKIQDLKFESIYDIFGSAQIDVKMDSESVKKLVPQLIEDEKSEYVETKFVLKDDGIYANDNLFLVKELLVFPENQFEDELYLNDFEYNESEVDLNYLNLDR